MRCKDAGCVRSGATDAAEDAAARRSSAPSATQPLFRQTLLNSGAMVCPSCSTENRPGRKFCARCGSALALACPSCGAANEPDDAFCGDCGTPLTAEAPAVVRAEPSAERRLVSVLFADLVGFTALSESRDAEEVRELLSRYFDI